MSDREEEKPEGIEALSRALAEATKKHRVTFMEESGMDSKVRIGDWVRDSVGLEWRVLNVREGIAYAGGNEGCAVEGLVVLRRPLRVGETYHIVGVGTEVFSAANLDNAARGEYFGASTSRKHLDGHLIDTDLAGYLPSYQRDSGVDGVTITRPVTWQVMADSYKDSPQRFGATLSSQPRHGKTQAMLDGLAKELTESRAECERAHRERNDAVEVTVRTLAECERLRVDLAHAQQAMVDAEAQLDPSIGHAMELSTQLRDARAELALFRRTASAKELREVDKSTRMICGTVDAHKKGR